MSCKLWCRTDDGVTYICSMHAAADTMLVGTPVGKQQIGTRTACTKANHTFPGVDANGDVTVNAYYGGAPDNALQVEFATGPTGAGNESLALRLEVTGSMPAQQVSVLFATDGAGASITPTATDVAALLNTDSLAMEVVEATAGGTGLSDVVAAGLTNLSGGLDDGDRVTVRGKPDADRLVHRLEAI